MVSIDSLILVKRVKRKEEGDLLVEVVTGVGNVRGGKKVDVGKLRLMCSVTGSQTSQVELFTQKHDGEGRWDEREREGRKVLSMNNQPFTLGRKKKCSPLFFLPLSFAPLLLLFLYSSLPLRSILFFTARMLYGPKYPKNEKKGF